MYRDTEIAIDANKDTKKKTNLGGRQRCNTYLHNRYIMTALFADDQVIIADSEESLQRAAHQLYMTSKQYNLRISIKKTKAMAFKG
ncbi:hypothetical protein ILUMI_08229 [Ignelater luminosus]|uniref:Reverse transcriptase domain-containing protein n=1 Tax=Ignelater luminosus TaxID=2038154 RepID=A0A8K0GG46_IGNLU|nr:hypothetical protein ILUMI_08229 [Ignelater luminosus]